MLVQVCLLLLSVGVNASYADSSESTTEDGLFDEIELFPENFLLRFPQEGEFFSTKILVYLFFNIFSKHFAENEPIKFWSKFNKNSFNRVAVDAVFYEYLTNFTDKKMKQLVFNPLESSTSSTDYIAIDRIGEYLDNLSEAEVSADQSETGSQAALESSTSTTTEDIAIDRIGEYLDNLSADEVSTDQSETRSQADKTIGHKHSDPECILVPSRDPIFGIPGKDFPNFCDIPETSFTCTSKLIPGVYADIETGCQVFHACWPDRIDSFLCPIGTTFNQNLLTCDFWHASDCSSSLKLFDYSPFAKDKTPRDTKSTNALNDETLITLEIPLASIPELDIPEYDGTCQSLISKPLQLHMKFLPAKCEVRDLKPSTPEATSKSSKYDGPRISDLTRLPDLLSGVFRNVRISELAQLPDDLSSVFADALVSILEEDGGDIARILEFAKYPKLKEMLIPKSDSRILEAATELASKPEEFDTTSEEQIHHSTTELPAEDLPPSANSRFVEKPVFKATSQEKVKPGRRIPLKPNKLSEDPEYHALAVMMNILEASSLILGDYVLPFMQQTILDYQERCSN